MSDMRSVKYARCSGDDGDGGRAVVESRGAQVGAGGGGSAESSAVVESMGELSPQLVLAGLGPAAAVAGESWSAQGGSG